MPVLLANLFYRETLSKFKNLEILGLQNNL